MKRNYKLKFNPDENYNLSNRGYYLSHLGNFEALREGINIAPVVSLTSHRLSQSTCNTHFDHEIEELLERKGRKNEKK